MFNSIRLKKPKKNFFDLSHDVKMSHNMGDLVPICAIECVPGDKFSIGVESLHRFAPLVAPVMHRFDVYTHYFFVPNRILWKNWEKFITNTKDKATDEVPAAPYFALGIRNGSPTMDISVGSLADYMGLPTGDDVGGLPDYTDPIKINALPFAAYQRIWHEYYRDQNLQDVDPLELEDGANDYSDFSQLRKRAWKHDYFTAALPFAQKGETVDLPLGAIELEDMPVLTTDPAGSVITATPNNLTLEAGITDLPNTDVYVPGGIHGQVEPTTINDLRRAFRLQEWLERNARGGTRYIENILSHFGVRSSDKRLNRPEYICGAKTPITVSEVLQTSESNLGEENSTPQGNMAGHAVGVMTGKQGTYFVEEHGYIIGIMSVLPIAAYQQGIPRHFLKFDFLDYYWPTFAHLGEQEIKNMELYVTDDNSQNEGTFGYIPRYAEYKYTPSRVAGEFRTSLNFWHAGRIFDDAPMLNEDFIMCDPTTRIFAVEDDQYHKLYSHVYNRIKAIRPMPKFGTPTI
ncbi:MAG: major capsid protein [Candidatus Methanomethylicaceae archaeon]